jgi:hypothetical protein
MSEDGICVGSSDVTGQLDDLLLPSVAEGRKWTVVWGSVILKPDVSCQMFVMCCCGCEYVVKCTVRFVGDFYTSLITQYLFAGGSALHNRVGINCFFNWFFWGCLEHIAQFCMLMYFDLWRVWCDVDHTVVLLLSVQTARERVVTEAFGCQNVLRILGFFGLLHIDFVFVI